MIFTNLLILEKDNVPWQSVIKKVLRGIINRITETLPSPDRIKRWGKKWYLNAPFEGTQVR